MKKLFYAASAVLSFAALGISAFADDPVLSDVIEKEQNVFEIHMSLPQFIIIAIFIFCAAALIHINFQGVNRKGSSTEKKNGGSINETPVIAEIEKADPTFDAQALRDYAARVYLELRSAICDKNLEDVRPFVTDGVISQIQKNVDYYISRGQTKHYEKSNIYSVRIAKFKLENGMQIITVRLHVSFIEYSTDDASGKLVSGSRDERTTRFYKLRFCRDEGISSDASYSLISDTCPACGAPISVNSNGVCEYCHHDLNEGKYGFVLCSYERWKNKEPSERSDAKHKESPEE